MVCTGCGIIGADAWPNWWSERLARRTVTRTLMQRSHAIILPFFGSCCLAAVVRGRYGTIIRDKQPRRFWRYVYSTYVVLLLCAGVIL